MKISRLYVYSSEEEVSDGDVEIVLPESVHIIPLSVILEDEVGQHRFDLNPELSQLARDEALKHA